MNKQLLTAALAVFATYPEAEEVLVCEDGNVFLAERRNLAENHCREARIPAPIVVKREEVEKASKKGARPDAEAAAKEAEEKAAAEAAAKEAEEKAQSELPTMPGYYADKDGVHWLLNEDGTWSWKNTGTSIDRSGKEDMKAFAPFAAIEQPKEKGNGKKGAGK